MSIEVVSESVSLRGADLIPAEAAAILLDKPSAREVESPQMKVAVPRHIPKSLWTEEIAASVTDFVRDEVHSMNSERQDFVRKLARWKVLYQAPVSDSPKNFPILNASDLTVPVIKEIVNTIAAQLIQATLTNRPWWVFSDLAPEWEPFIDELERFFDVSAERDLNLDIAAQHWIIEGCKLGTAILEVSYDVDERNIYRYGSDGESVYKTKVVKRDGPRVKAIPLQNFWTRFHETDVQSARIVGTQHWFDENQILGMAAQGVIVAPHIILSRGGSRENEDDVHEVENEIQDTEETLSDNSFELFRFFLSFDIDGDGLNEEIMVWYSRELEAIVGAFFFPYDHGKRPFIRFGFMEHEHRFYAEGLCEMLEQIQIAISAQHNRRADNATMANLKMFLKRRLVKGLQPGDPLYLGKQIEVNDIWNDIREFQMAEVYPSTVNEEGILRNYAERISGVNDAVLGAAMPVTRTTATAQLQLLQEQLKRIDISIRSIRKGLTETGVQSLELYQQFGTNGKGIAWLGREHGLMIEALFQLPRRVTDVGMALKVSTPTSLQNRTVQREDALAQFNLLVTLYQQILPLAQALAPEGMAEIVRAMVGGARKVMGDVFETFESSDPEDALAGLEVLERLLPKPEDLGGLESFEGRENVAEVVEQLTGVADLLPAVEEFKRTSDSISAIPESIRRANTAPGNGSGSRRSVKLGGNFTPTTR